MSRPDEATESQWRKARIAIAFRLGEIRLYSWGMTALVHRLHFSKVARDSVDLEPLFQQLKLGVDALFLPCRPVAVAPTTIEVVGDVFLYTPKTFQNYYVDLESLPDFSGYLAKFSGKSRSTLMRKVRKFKDECSDGQVVREFAHGDEFDEFFRLAGEISKDSYQERLLNIGLPRDAEFIAMTKSRAESGRAMGWLLYCRGRAVAYVLAFIDEGVATYDYVGYLSECQHLSPGTVLQFYILESLFASRRVRMFDFTEGEGEHKRFFSTGSQLCAKTYVFRRSLRARMLVAIHRALDAAVTATGRALDSVGLKSKLRAMVRRLA